MSPPLPSSRIYPLGPSSLFFLPFLNPNPPLLSNRSDLFISSFFLLSTNTLILDGLSKDDNNNNNSNNNNSNINGGYNYSIIKV